MAQPTANDVLRQVYVELMNIATMIDDYVNPEKAISQDLQADSSLGDSKVSSSAAPIGNMEGGKKKARKPFAKAAPKPAAKAAPKKKK